MTSYVLTNDEQVKPGRKAGVLYHSITWDIVRTKSCFPRLLGLCDVNFTICPGLHESAQTLCGRPLGSLKFETMQNIHTTTSLTAHKRTEKGN